MVRRQLSLRFAQWPIRRKLLALALLPLLGVLPLLGLILLLWANVALDRMLITKVRADLAVAHGYFERVLNEVAASTRAVAESHALQRALAGWQPGQAPPPGLQALLREFKQREALDFIHLRAPDGTLLQADFDVAPDAAPLPRHSDDMDRSGASVAVLAPAEQGLLAPTLRERISVPLVPTRNAQPTARTHEDRAMVLRAGAPVVDDAGRPIAQLQAGLLLNRNLPFIDHINLIVYPEGSLPFGSRGTATLFLDDVRISTNVRLFGINGEERAIGTRVSQAVREAVLVHGDTWLDRAFVVDDWYVSAYEPLHDAEGRPIGMLYVGYLERPFAWLKYGVLAGIGLVFFAVMLLSAWAALRWARGIFQPLEQMALTMRRVEAGALDARVGPVASGDEIGALAGHLDHLLDTIDANTRELQRWNSELDAKVAERTRALEAAQQQLLRSEKMAAVGQLTASIAHEVNNPIAVIQGNLDLARELLGADAQRVLPELTLIDAQIERMRLIVTQLLQFARPTEYAGYVDNVDPARTLEDCLVLTGHLLARSRIVLERDYAATRSVAVNRQELQQVLVNLLVNAIHAMPEGGQLRLATRDQGSGAQARVEIEVADTGAGLPEDLVAELFRPFVTRKPDGTGLGLWISRSLVERYGGDIRAANRRDGVAGAVFTVVLRHELAPDKP
ncbi:cache domain-containing protein [Aquabacterium sp.]|uniref:sensor histidine kinase n=1 Tax=Aquabacterium sp. TaxID=1872578 RepID=UPI0037850757